MDRITRFVGIDFSKTKLDVHRLPEERGLTVGNDQPGRGGFSGWSASNGLSHVRRPADDCGGHDEPLRSTGLRGVQSCSGAEPR